MHFDWCKHGNNAARVPTENTKRDVALEQCRKTKATKGQQPSQAGADPCALYANEAVKLAAKASALGCGFAGPRWLQDYGAHYNFCRSGVNPAILIAEHAARDSQYKACGGN